MTKKIDITKPVRLVQDHRPVRLLCDDAPGDHPLVGYFETGVGSKVLVTWTLSGIAKGLEAWEIENIPQKRTVYLNFYRDSETAAIHHTRKSADDGAGYARIACVEVTYEEGEGL